MPELTKEDQELAKMLFTFKDSLTAEEEEYYANLIKLCKEVKDSFYPVGDSSKLTLVDLHFRRKVDHANDEYIYMSGMGYINDENRCISGEIYNDNGRILVDMLVERLCVATEVKSYRVIDEFRKNKKSYTHSVYYDGKREKEMLDLDLNKVKVK